MSRGMRGESCDAQQPDLNVIAYRFGLARTHEATDIYCVRERSSPGYQ